MKLMNAEKQCHSMICLIMLMYNWDHSIYSVSWPFVERGRASRELSREGAVHRGREPWHSLPFSHYSSPQHVHPSYSPIASIANGVHCVTSSSFLVHRLASCCYKVSLHMLSLRYRADHLPLPTCRTSTHNVPLTRCSCYIDPLLSTSYKPCSKKDWFVGSMNTR